MMLEANTDLEQALKYFKEALQSAPNEVASHLNLSNVYITLGETELAMQHLRQALRLNPQHAESYNNLGRLYYKQGIILEAVPLFEKALRINPHLWEAHYNLAHSLASQNKMEQAGVHYREVIRLFPEHPIARFHLGLIYADIGDNTLAEIHLKKSLELDPNNIEAAKQLGQVYVNLGKLEEALTTYDTLLQLSPELSDIHHNIAILYLRNQEKLKALLHFEKSLALDPNNDTARHMVMALRGENTSAAPSQYIAQLFDQYAEYYNEHLKTKLKYAAPALLRNAVGSCLGTNPTAGRVCDLGCGTGLAGIVFRDLARDLIGVDLSAKMLEKAEILGAYDKLIVSDINEYLQTITIDDRFHLIIATDVLVYSGDLRNLFKNITNALHPNGFFAFTTEYLASGTYALQVTGRFAHSSEYIQSLATEYGLTLKVEEPLILREHEERPVSGRIYVLRQRA